VPRVHATIVVGGYDSCRFVAAKKGGAYLPDSSCEHYSYQVSFIWTQLRDVQHYKSLAKC
jgi:hypothetical protein